MKEFVLQKWLRSNILEMKSYSSARDEYSGEAMVFLDANENPFDSELNRYPDPKQVNLKELISKNFDIEANQIFLGNGSDEAIDLLIRVSCEPYKDRVISISPSYGMYKVCADVQGVPVDKVLLNDDFSFNPERIISSFRPDHKLLFLCSPNNPTGNSILPEDLKLILSSFSGVVVVDEAYIDFSVSKGFIKLIEKYSNLVLLRTFSKAWGLAGARCGLALANEDIVSALSKIKYPYNINTLTQKVVAKAFENQPEIQRQLNLIIEERESLMIILKTMKGIQEVFPSDANFVLVRVDNPDELYQSLINEGIVVRNRNSQDLCQGCLRLTVGHGLENQKLITALQKLLS